MKNKYELGRWCTIILYMSILSKNKVNILQNRRIKVEKLIQSFLNECSELPYNSYKSVLADCKNINEYLNMKQTSFTIFSDNTAVQKYADYLLENSSPNTARRRICTLRKLIHWCEDNGFINGGDTNLSVSIEETEPKYASESDIKKLYSFCKDIFEADGYVLARAKLECYLIITMGFKVSELKKLRVDDIYSLNNKTAKSFLMIREQFMSERLIKSDILFVTKYCGENNRINIDYDLIREKLDIDRSVTLSSIRNTCIINFENVGKNENLTTSFFGVTVERISRMREHNLIVQLPCQVGSTVYLIGSVQSGRQWEKTVISGKIDRFIIGGLGVPLADICTDNNDWYIACSYPNDYFLTREEAQETLNKNGGAEK